MKTQDQNRSAERPGTSRPGSGAPDRGENRGETGSVTLAIGVDVGGTKVAAGVVDEDGRIIAKVKRSTPAASPSRTEQAIADAVTDLLASAHGSRRSVSARPGSSTAPGRPCCSPRTWPGAMSRSSSGWRSASAARSWWRTTRTPRPGARPGSARRAASRDVMLVALGHGHRRRPHHRRRAPTAAGGGSRGELGHVRVVPDGRLCGCGNRGCWEQYCSGNALVAEARELPGGRRAAPSGCFSWATVRPRASPGR